MNNIIHLIKIDLNGQKSVVFKNVPYTIKISMKIICDILTTYVYEYCSSHLHLDTRIYFCPATSTLKQFYSY